MGKKFYLLLIVILVITFIVYLPLVNGFFQHDEWRNFGHVFSEGKDLLSIIKPTHSHYTPFTEIFFYLYLSIFKLNFSWFVLMSIVGHLIVVYFSYILFSELLKNRLLSILACLFFALETSGHQATSWIAADINTHGSTIFGLLALIVLYKFNKLWLSIIFLIISLLFKEITIAFFILIPLMIYIFDKKKFIINKLNYIKVVVVGFLYLVFRFSMLFFQETDIADKLVIETQSFSNIFYNMITFPAKIFSQSIIPTGQLLSIARSISKLLPSSVTGLFGTTAFDIFVEGTALQVLNWVIFITCTLLLIYITRKSKNEPIKKVALFGFVFIVLNSLIYILSPGRSGNIPVIDSRNIYLPSIGTSLFLVSVTYLFLKEKAISTIFLLTLFITLNLFWLKRELKLIIDKGTERKEILYQIRKTYPTLPPKVIFYMLSDKPFYGLPESETIFPFETNLGYIIMVWYQPTEYFPRELVKPSDFLYKLTEQDYKEIDGRGFGYYRNERQLVKALKDNSLEADSVIAFSYNSSNKTIKDITSQVREKIN